MWNQERTDYLNGKCNTVGQGNSPGMGLIFHKAKQICKQVIECEKLSESRGQELGVHYTSLLSANIQPHRESLLLTLTLWFILPVLKERQGLPLTHWWDLHLLPPYPITLHPSLLCSEPPRLGCKDFINRI